jgi:colanic acid biosynthesis glycosyl transferase WcaI
MTATISRTLTGGLPRLRILFLALCYAPEEVSGAVLITELAEDLASKGHDVTVVTAAPSYPLGKIPPPYRNRLFQKEFINDVRVIRVWSDISGNRSAWRRALHQATYCLFASLGGLFSPPADIVFSYSPPLPLGVSAWFISFFKHAPWILQLEDIFPDAAISAGVLKNKLMISFFRKMEAFLYRRAARVSVITAGFKDNLIEKGVPAEKISVIPVWADSERIKPSSPRNDFSRRAGLEGKYLVLYAGNLGVASCPEVILEAAASLSNVEDIHFVIVGEGCKKEQMMKTASELGLRNILFLPFQPRETYAEMLAAGHVHLVMLNTQAARTSLPSKIFNIMAAARPIILIAPPDSETAALVRETGCGLVVSLDRPDQVVREILALKSHPDLADWLGRNGRANLEARHSRSRCTRLHEQMLLQTACKGKVAE